MHFQHSGAKNRVFGQKKDTFSLLFSDSTSIPNYLNLRVISKEKHAGLCEIASQFRRPPVLIENPGVHHNIVNAWIITQGQKSLFNKISTCKMLKNK